MIHGGGSLACFKTIDIREYECQSPIKNAPLSEMAEKNIHDAIEGNRHTR
jgi:hypothetical protein